MGLLRDPNLLGEAVQEGGGYYWIWIDVINALTRGPLELIVMQEFGQQNNGKQ